MAIRARVERYRRKNEAESEREQIGSWAAEITSFPPHTIALCHKTAANAP